MRRPIPSLTGLRFFAAACVVLAHGLPELVKYTAPPRLYSLVIGTSAEGMTLFFVLSGFVIYYNYSETIGSRAGLWDFFIARVARLYPLFAVCLAYDFLRSFGFDQFPTSHVSAIPFYLTLTQTWFYLPIGGSSLVYQFGLLPSVGWSISTELFFYLAFPAICLLIGRLHTNRTRLVAAISLSVVAIAILTILHLWWLSGKMDPWAVSVFGEIASTSQDSFYRWLVYFSPYTRIFEFGLGCLTAAIATRLPLPTASENRKGAVAIAIILASVVALHLAMFWNNGGATMIGQLIFRFHTNFAFAPMFAGFIFCCVRYDNAFVRFVSQKWIVLGGEISYSIYMLHLLVFNAFRYEAATITSWNVALGSYMQFFVAVAAIVGLSLLSWRFIEVPSRRAIRGFARRATALQSEPRTEPQPSAA
jgi:peptidoglycan/LPS O-acetylase OafA/YrhL